MGLRAGLILANRAYCDHEAPPGEERQVVEGSGGLVVALRGCIEPWNGTTGTTWIGAGRGSCDSSYTDERGFEIVHTTNGPLHHRRLYFDDVTWSGHYAQSANSFLWPLVHLVREPLPARTRYYPAPVSPSESAWQAYEAVNRRFAAAVFDQPETPHCWVHDYQLALVPRMLRAGGDSAPVGYFLHTSFPDIDVASPFLDERGAACFREFVQGMLGADLIGMQTDGDVARLRKAAVNLGLAAASGEALQVEGRPVYVRAYPVGIDPDDVLDAAARGSLPDAVRDAHHAAGPLVVGLERADFTKGIPERLEAIASVFARGRRFTYAGVAAPTRDGVAAYDDLGPAIAERVALCEEAARAAGGCFVHVERTLEWPEVVALLRDADVVFTSSLADGMNLVPLQAAIAQSRKPAGSRGVIITGRDAGVAHAYAGFEEDGLVPVDPLNVDALASTLEAALSGRPGRISDRLIAAVHHNDARAWATRFLTDLEASC